MPARDSALSGAPCWVDLMTSDTSASRDFYGALFDWTAEEPNEELAGYFNFRKNDVRIAGCMASQPGAPVTDVWSVYLASDDAQKTLDAAEAAGADADASAQRIVDLGGSLVHPPHDSPYGRLVAAADPTGATFKLREA